jgi:hypothetical protein
MIALVSIVMLSHMRYSWKTVFARNTCHMSTVSFASFHSA